MCALRLCAGQKDAPVAETPVAPDLFAPVIACIEGRLPAPVALMQLASAAPDAEAIDSTLREAFRHASGSGIKPLEELHALRLRAADKLERMRDIASVARRAHSGEHDWARTFDEAARISPEASVALYSLGEPELLQRQTEELVSRMAEWGLLQDEFHVLDFGCGIGRIATAIAPRVAGVVGVDISPEMVRLARERTASLGNIAIAEASAGTLGTFADASFDAVLAIDSVPYVVASGLAEFCFRDTARVLKPDGLLLIMNYSYRGDLSLDRAELQHLVDRYGFDIERNGTSDLSLWDGCAFLLRKR